MRWNASTVVWRGVAGGCLAVLWAASGGAPPVRAASSQDYPGPCMGEQVAVSVPETPLYLSADYHGLNPDFGIIFMPDVGRIRLGISCVATGYVVVRVGPDSALCTLRGRCTEDQLRGLTQQDVEAVLGIPGEVPFFHICQKHGFGWYDAIHVAPGIYLAIALSGSGFFGLVDGHGTADTYSFFGNGGAYQPVNCYTGGGGGGGGGDGGGGGGGCGDGPYLCPLLEENLQ
jgi:hypothetical protein